MKYLFLLLAGFLMSSQIYSQNLKTKKKISRFTKEVYQIDKKSKMKNGFYYKISKNSKDTLVVGNYLNGRKTGLWTYYKMNGEKYIEYNYSSKTINALYGEAHKSDSTYIIRGNEFVLDKVDSPQIYLGFENEGQMNIATSIKLPINIMENNVTGRSIATFVVDEHGKMIDQKIELSLNKELDKKILDEIKKLEDNWIPAKKNGKAISSKIIFTLNVNNSSPNKQEANLKKELPYMWQAELAYSSVVRTRKVISRRRMSY